LPGAFVYVELEESGTQEVPTIPASALLQDSRGTYVFVVGDDNKAEVRRIRTVARIGTDYAVDSGLKPGESVIVSGIQKVKPGEVVKTEAAPQASAASANQRASGG
ncbi:MAG: efflux transporter periplasmic adaptor subunit, partial [Pseudomonadota bacterium]